MDTTPHYQTTDNIDNWVVDSIRELGTTTPTWSQLDDVAANNIDGTAADCRRDYWVAMCDRAGAVCPDGDPVPMDLDTYLQTYTFPGVDNLIFRDARLINLTITHDTDGDA